MYQYTRYFAHHLRLHRRDTGIGDANKQLWVYVYRKLISIRKTALLVTYFS